MNNLEKTCAYAVYGGKSKKAYCAENGINEATFYYWFSRSKENDTFSGIMHNGFFYTEYIIVMTPTIVQ
ncbi:hypothetical protein FAZ19_07915 [Sphingobacterium alkalisoli]|uniref:Uncharacterized protein n=1 Tax=Sphingobacterium alkalisoli TaxID=1874115 RepID=A0A4U0H5B6_9SPHI|nr:hypothetical protein FAZ19_07915 [Sphingobacterium alkalisoli]